MISPQNTHVGVRARITGQRAHASAQLGRADITRFRPRYSLLAPRYHGIDQVSHQARQSDFQLSVLGANLTPESLRWALDHGAAGDLSAQNALFDLMEDTWDRLRGNVERLKKAVCKLPFTVQPWSEKGREPSPAAVEKAQFVEHVLHNQRASTWEGRLNFTGTVNHLLDAIGRGVSVLEVDWAIADGRYVPTATRRVPWACLGFDRRPEAPDPDRFGSFRTHLENPRRFWSSRTSFSSAFTVQSRPLGEARSFARSRHSGWVGCSAGNGCFRARSFRTADSLGTYDPAATTDQIAAVNNMLANMGTAAWGSFPLARNWNYFPARRLESRPE